MINLNLALWDDERSNEGIHFLISRENYDWTDSTDKAFQLNMNNQRGDPSSEGKMLITCLHFSASHAVCWRLNELVGWLAGTETETELLADGVYRWMAGSPLRWWSHPRALTEPRPKSISITCFMNLFGIIIRERIEMMSSSWWWKGSALNERAARTDPERCGDGGKWNENRRKMFY